MAMENNCLQTRKWFLPSRDNTYPPLFAEASVLSICISVSTFLTPEKSVLLWLLLWTSCLTLPFNQWVKENLYCMFILYLCVRYDFASFENIFQHYEHGVQKGNRNLGSFKYTGWERKAPQIRLRMSLGQISRLCSKQQYLKCPSLRKDSMPRWISLLSLENL